MSCFCATCEEPLSPIESLVEDQKPTREFSEGSTCADPQKLEIPIAGQSGQFGNDANNTPVDPALTRYLEAHRSNAKYLVAVVSTDEADSIILETNQPVMALGGFTGGDPILTTAQLATLVKKGLVRFFLLNDSVSFGGNQNALTSWVKQHSTVVPASLWQSTSMSEFSANSQLYISAG